MMDKMDENYIDREVFYNKFSGDIKPRLKADPGDTVTFKTYDCFTNRYLPEDATYENTPHLPGNPVSGPLYIRTAAPGDLLKIKIIKIATGPVGVVDLGPASGCLREHFPDRKIWRIPVKDGIARIENNIRYPVKPMIGTIGLAPSDGEYGSMVPTAFGGNMDCTRITEGSTLYLPVGVPGALLSMGDVHAIMGDGETEDCGLEIEAEVTVRTDVLHNTGITFPVIETEDAFISVASEETTDDAWRKADEYMFSLLTGQGGIDVYEAGMLLTLAGNLVICQTVNPAMTVRMEFPKKLAEQYGFTALKSMPAASA